MLKACSSGLLKQSLSCVEIEPVVISVLVNFCDSTSLNCCIIGSSLEIFTKVMKTLEVMLLDATC